jgi:putative flippase GtrA
LIRTALHRAYNSTPLRFLIAGGWNTAFGYASLALLYYLFSDKIQYLILIAFSTILNITNAYICHKFFVFRTKGNYLKEYLRYYVVYSIPIGLAFVLFPFCIEVLGMNFYVVQAILTFITVITSYFGHKHVSFRQGGKQNVGAQI